MTKKAMLATIVAHVTEAARQLQAQPAQYDAIYQTLVQAMQPFEDASFNLADAYKLDRELHTLKSTLPQEVANSLSIPWFTSLFRQYRSASAIYNALTPSHHWPINIHVTTSELSRQAVTVPCHVDWTCSTITSVEDNALVDWSFGAESGVKYPQVVITPVMIESIEFNSHTDDNGSVIIDSFHVAFNEQLLESHLTDMILQSGFSFKSQPFCLQMQNIVSDLTTLFQQELEQPINQGLIKQGHHSIKLCDAILNLNGFTLAQVQQLLGKP